MNLFGIIGLTLIFVTTFTFACITVDQIPKSSDDPRILAPWTASIFKKNNNTGEWEYHCGATITNLHVVITSANCVSKLTDNFENVHSRYSDLRIVAGLLTNDYVKGRDENTQEVEVAMIREHRVPSSKTSSGYEQSYLRSTNLAGIRLKTQLNFTAYVQAVCLLETPNSIQETRVFIPGEIGSMATFQKSKLQIHQIKIQDTLTCLKSYWRQPFNVACGKLADESPIPCFSEGSGLIMSTDGNNTGIGYIYLMGVYTSNSATKAKDYPYPIHSVNERTCCSKKDLIYFTKHGEYYRWAVSHGFCSHDLLQCQSDRCRPLKELCDGVTQCEDGTDESSEICQNNAEDLKKAN